MDAYGNITDISEFAGGRRVRFVSYLNPKVNIGVSDSAPLTQPALVTTQSLDDSTVFCAQTESPGRFSLISQAFWRRYVTWDPDDHDRLTVQDVGAAPIFTVDFVDGCWFALNNASKDRVVDVYRGTENGGTWDTGGDGQRPPFYATIPIIAFAWNGGANQIWRANTTGPGITEPSAPAPSLLHDGHF
jgi:hypothetical protein